MAGRRLVSAWRCSLPVVDPPFPQEPVRARVVENPAAFAARSGREVVVGPLDAPSTSMFANLRPSGRSVLGRAAFVPGGRNMHTEHPARRTQVRTPQESSSRPVPRVCWGGLLRQSTRPELVSHRGWHFLYFHATHRACFVPGALGVLAVCPGRVLRRFVGGSVHVWGGGNQTISAGRGSCAVSVERGRTCPHRACPLRLLPLASKLCGVLRRRPFLFLYYSSRSEIKVRL